MERNRNIRRNRIYGIGGITAIIETFIFHAQSGIGMDKESK
jgi:hypothetical protein